MIHPAILLVAASLVRSAAAPEGFESSRLAVRAAFGADRPWEALPLAEALAARPGLDSEQRSWALREAARLRRSVGDAGGAEADLQKALAASPDDADAAFELALLLRDERPEDALVYAGRAAERAAGAPRRVEALRLSGGIRLDMGDTRGAVRELGRALAGDEADLDCLMAMARASSAEPARAAAWASRAEAAAGGVPSWYRGSALRAVARLWRELGDDARAAAAFERAVAVDPDELDGLEGLAAIRGKSRAGAAGAEPAVQPLAAPRAGELETLRVSIDRAIQGRDAQRALASADLFLEAVPRAPAWRQADAYRLVADRLLAMGTSADFSARAQGASWRAYTLRPHSVAVARLLSRTRPTFDTPTAPGSPEFTARAYAALAQARSKLGDDAGARQAIERGLSVAPDSPELLLAAGRPERALAALPSLGPQLEAAVRVRVLRGKAGAARAAGDAESAERTLVEALALVPDDREALGDMVDLLMSRGRWREALAYADRLLAQLSQRATERGSAARLKARAQLGLGDAAGAEATLRQVLAQAPADAQTLCSLLELELAQGRASQALSDARRFIRDEGRSAPAERASALVWMARAQRALEDRAGAEASLQTALTLDAGSRDALAEMARSQADGGRAEAALGYAERLLSAIPEARGPERAEAYLLEARILRGRKDEAGARARLERALALAPANRGALLEMIGLELRRRRPDRALERARFLVSVSTGDGAEARARGCWWLAQAQRAMGDAAGARASLERALGLAPGFTAALWDLVDLDVEKGGVRAAEAALEGHQPAVDDPSRAAWLVRRGLVRALRGDPAEAERDFRAAVERDAQVACRGPGLPARRDRLPPSYFDACLTRFPRDAALYLDRGLAWFKAGRPEAAVGDFRRAAALEPEWREARLSLEAALASKSGFSAPGRRAKRR